MSIPHVLNQQDARRTVTQKGKGSSRWHQTAGCLDWAKLVPRLDSFELVRRMYVAVCSTVGLLRNPTSLTVPHWVFSVFAAHCDCRVGWALYQRAGGTEGEQSSTPMHMEMIVDASSWPQGERGERVVRDPSAACWQGMVRPAPVASGSGCGEKNLTLGGGVARGSWARFLELRRTPCSSGGAQGRDCFRRTIHHATPTSTLHVFCSLPHRTKPRPRGRR